MNSKATISVALATYNEEEMIGDCLASVREWADEIVIADGNSTDKTVQIAKKYGAKIISTSNKPMFHLNKNLAIDYCRSDWILQLDADERVSPSLRKEILEVISNPRSADAYWIKRKNYFLGRFLTKGGQYPDPVVRLFRRGKAWLPAKSVHEQMTVSGTIGWLENDLIHWATPYFSRYLQRENRYSTLAAAEMFSRGVRINPLSMIKYLIVLPAVTFLAIFVRHKGFVDGWQGFIFAFFSGFHHAWSYWKYLKMRLRRSGIIEDWK